MFYCENCAEENEWPKPNLIINGTCESCKESKLCFAAPKHIILAPPENSVNPVEIRLGNILSNGSAEFVMNTAGLMDVLNVWQSHEICWWEPVLITKEWLKKFGFENGVRRYAKTFIIRCDHREVIKIKYNRYGQDKWYYGNRESFFHKPKYIHELQNLYFSLTNQELTYEQTN